jgi:hypothetical protein
MWQEYSQEITNNPDDSLDSRWNKITRAIHKTSEEVFGKTSRKQLNDWFDIKSQKATNAKNKAYINMQKRNHPTASTDKYQEARRK